MTQVINPREILLLRYFLKRVILKNIKQHVSLAKPYVLYGKIIGIRLDNAGIY
jgi:hypothetical protein